MTACALVDAGTMLERAAWAWDGSLANLGSLVFLGLSELAFAPFPATDAAFLAAGARAALGVAVAEVLRALAAFVGFAAVVLPGSPPGRAPAETGTTAAAIALLCAGRTTVADPEAAALVAVRGAIFWLRTAGRGATERHGRQGSGRSGSTAAQANTCELFTDRCLPEKTRVIYSLF